MPETTLAVHGKLGLGPSSKIVLSRELGKSDKSNFELRLMVGQTQNKQLAPVWKVHLHL